MINRKVLALALGLSTTFGVFALSTGSASAHGWGWRGHHGHVRHFHHNHYRPHCFWTYHGRVCR